MKNETAVEQRTLGKTDLEQLRAKVNYYMHASKALNTRRGYRSDWSDFEHWCLKNGYPFLPASEDAVILYISILAEANMKMSTIGRRITSISIAHQAKGYASPTHSLKVKTVWKGIRNEHGVIEVGKTPILVKDLRQMVEFLPINMRGFRDRALLLIGFAGAFRRSELVRLNVDDIAFIDNGLTILIRKSKTDQEGQGRKIGIPYGSNLETCPVRSLKKWLEIACITQGSVFRKVSKSDRVEERRLCDKSVALIVKRAAESAGLDPMNYAGHSLRAGLATSAAIAGVSEWSIMQQTGHKSTAMVRRYIRDGNLFRDNASAQIGL